MKVLISGGGVAGLTLAFWLHRSGATPVIVERSSEIRSGQFGIDFFGTAHDVITRMGLADRVEAHQIPIDSIAFVDGAGSRSGRRFGRLDRTLLERAVRGPHTPVLHGDLEQILADAVSPDVEIRHGTSVSAVQPLPGAVQVTFADGTQEEFDLLVGADGAPRPFEG